MREIKFRAWNKYHKKWTTFEPHWIFDDRAGTFRLIYNVMDDSIELMQFTGLLDVTGKEIYEGDILRVDWQDGRYPVHIIGPVTWNIDEASWSLGEGGSAKHDAAYYMNVIGNMYENPELLNPM